MSTYVLSDIHGEYDMFIERIMKSSISMIQY
jgi:hypothetical protein